jgi:hypothetical protein
MLTKGIILIATGSPYYGKMAYNLAVTVKAVEDIPITILYGGMALSHLSPEQEAIFNTRIQIDHNSFGSKLCLSDYSPYDCTLYLDADMVWLPGKKPSQLFKELEGVAFTSITEGYYDYAAGVDYGNSGYHYWCDPLEAKEKWKLEGKFYQWRSEIMYFEKAGKELFKLAKKVYQSPKVTVKKFANTTPDELAINIAASKLNIEPHQYRWKPAYWHRLHGEGKGLPEIIAEYYLLSAGGNFASQIMKNCYNNVCKAAHRTLGLRFLFELQSKKSVMPDRIKM